jgi:hypothetical protein
MFRVARTYAAACVLFSLCFVCVGDVFLARSGSVQFFFFFFLTKVIVLTFLKFKVFKT